MRRGAAGSEGEAAAWWPTRARAEERCNCAVGGGWIRRIWGWSWMLRVGAGVGGCNVAGGWQFRG